MEKTNRRLVVILIVCLVAAFIALIFAFVNDFNKDAERIELAPTLSER